MINKKWVLVYFPCFKLLFSLTWTIIIGYIMNSFATKIFANEKIINFYKTQNMCLNNFTHICMQSKYNVSMTPWKDILINTINQYIISIYQSYDVLFYCNCYIIFWFISHFFQISSIGDYTYIDVVLWDRLIILQI